MPDSKPKQVVCRLSPELFAAIEATRGRVPRERWMRSVFEAAVAQKPRAVSSAPAKPARKPRVPPTVIEERRPQWGAMTGDTMMDRQRILNEAKARRGK